MRNERSPKRHQKGWLENCTSLTNKKLERTQTTYLLGYLHLKINVECLTIHINKQT